MPKDKKNWRSILTKIWKKYQSQLLSNMISVAVVALLVKGVGFFKEILIADKYGVSELLDTYLIAALIPTFVQNVFLNSYSSVFIPNYVLEKKLGQGIGTFQSSSFIITIGIAFVMMVITYLGIDVYLEILFPGHEPRYYELIKIQLWIILPCMLFWALSSLISGILRVENEYFYSSLNAVFVPASTIVLLFFFQETFQEKTLAIGMLIGSVISCVYLVILGFKKQIFEIGKPSFKGENLQVMIKQVPAKISSSLIHGLNPIVDQYYSARLTVGALATLNYGTKITVVVIGLVTIPISNTLLPYFSEKAVEGRKILYNHLHRVLGAGLGLMSAVTIVLILLSKFIITIVFERGTFTSANTEEVYVIQQLYLIQLPFYVSAIVMNRYLNAINKNNFLVISSMVNLVMNIILNYVFLEWLGIKGIALATSAVYFVNALIIYLYIRKLKR
ncbi:murein biosynthesis integral membrane protein MurJ [Flagellimonas marinaquae]|uniref:murein biosynthesis integral membrane protein MurJ n=1 Tax=Flagellimonas marinaquae TaxID=254955 RepID=UPI000F8F6762|nr:lipid II flippase MurJ [Allomuricauda aquimarina]